MSISFASNLGDLIGWIRTGSVEQATQLVQFGPDFVQKVPWKGRFVAGTQAQVLTGAVDGEPALVEKGLDFKNQLHLFAGVEALSRIRPAGAEACLLAREA